MTIYCVRMQSFLPLLFVNFLELTQVIGPSRADQGRFLDYIVSWGNLTEERVALYLTEVLEALHYLHSWRIAHLDLKVNKCS